MTKIQREFELERIIFFSDAVFAIAITLLALTLEVPHLVGDVSDRGFLSALAEQGSQVLAFLISFAVIGEYWIAHHRIFARIQDWDAGLLVWNLGFLLTVVILPWPTEMIARYGHLASATMLYSLAVAACGLMLAALWAYARRRGLSVAMSRETFRASLMRTLASPSVFLLSIPVAYLNPTAAKFVWVVLLPLELYFDARIGKATRASS